MQESEIRESIGIIKACEVTHVCRRTMYNWIKSGKVEYIRTAGGSVRIYIDSLWRDRNMNKFPRSPS